MHEAGLAATAEITPPTALFQGFDTFTTNGKATALEGTFSSTGGAERCDYTVCTSTWDFSQALDIQGELSASAVFGSVDVKTHYAHSLALSETSVVIVVYANSVGGTKSFTDVRLKDGFAIPGDVNDLYATYGDSWVSSITLGAEYIATYVFHCQTRDEQESIMTSLNASGVGEGGTVTASLDMQIKTVQDSKQTRSSFNQTTTGITGTALPAREDLAQFALSFGSLPPNPGTVIAFTTEGYESVGGLRGTMRPIVKTRNAFTGGPFRETGSLSDQLNAVIGLDNQTKQIEQVYAVYGYEGDADLRTKRAQVLVDRRTLSEALTEIATYDVTVVPSIPELPSLQFGYPAFNLTTPALHGTVGPPVSGTMVQDVGYEDVMAGMRIASVTLGVNRQEGVVHVGGVASVTYDRLDGPSTTLSHDRAIEGEYDESAPFVFQPGEHLVELTGNVYEDDFPALMAVTLKKRRGAEEQEITWPPTSQQWTTQSVTVPPDQFCVGFAADTAQASGNALGLLTTAFAPVTWEIPQV